MKRFISLLLVLTLIVSLSSEAQASSNTALLSSDMVAEDYWSYEALSAAIDTGLLQGNSGQIKPNDKMTRAEMITMVLRALGLSGLSGQDLTPYQSDISAFSDVKSTDWFYDQMAMAYRLKLIDGISGTKMSPKGIVTREQAFTILSRLMSLNSTTADQSVLNRFTDLNKLSTWAKPYAATMVAAGYISGYNNRLNPSDAISRQDFAQLMYNLFNRNYVSSQSEANALTRQSITGNLVISSGDIVLDNINITGDVIIGDGVGNGNVTLDHVKIGGRLIVRGGGEHSIYIKNSTANTIIVTKLSDGGIRLYSDDGSEVSYMEIPDGKDTVIIECDIENLVLSHDDLDIVIHKTVKNISLSGDNVHISGTGSIGTLTLEKGVTKVSLTAKSTDVINLSGTDVDIVDKDGKINTVTSSTPIINKTDTSNSGTSNTGTSNTGTSNTDPSVSKSTITFHSNGGSNLSSINVTNGNSLGNLPVPKKDNAIFIGWFTDAATFENGVTENTTVNSNMNLYADYIDSSIMAESNVQTTTSAMDVAPDYVINLLSTDETMTAANVKAAITLETITEETGEFGGFSVAGSNGVYTVTALNGYTEGCSYALILNHPDLSFKDESGSVRTYNLSVKMPDPVLKLTLSNNVKFIPVYEISTITQNGQAVQSIFAPLYTMEDSAPVDSLYGTFVYSGTQLLAIGDQLAIYEGTSPDARTATIDYTDQPISYATITHINGTTISYGNTDSAEVIFTPDVLPVNDGADEDGEADNSSITIAISNMTYDTADFAAMGLTASTTVDSGDFLAFYTGALTSANALTYAKITDVTIIGNYYVIQYEAVDELDVFSSMNMSTASDLNYQQLAANINLKDAETEIKQQVEDSGFADTATEYLIALAQADEETRQQICDTLGIQNFSATSTLRSAGPSASSAPKVDVKAKISKNLKHYTGSGLRCEVTVTCEVELGDNMTLTVSGTFVEEFKVSLSLNSKTIWKKKWIFPYIADYQVTANLDLYNYTYLAIKMSLTTNDDEGWSDELDIKDSIDDLKNLISSEEANSEVQKFYELYQNMLSQEHGYFDLFDVKISRVTGGIDPLHILGYGFTVSFVVSLDANVALGAEFGYEKATRYTFTLKVKDKSTSNSQTDLVSEKYNLIVYAMGELGVRAGIRLTVEVGLLDVSLNSIGISAEVGAYWKVWGFVYYELEHKNKVNTSKSSGSCYMEIGIYLTIRFIAQVGEGKIASYNKTLYDKSWPLWSAGSQDYIYDFAYTLTDHNDDIHLKGKSSSYTLPTSVYKMNQMDFKTGDVSIAENNSNKYKYTIKDDPNHVFSVSNTGVISVTPPAKSDIATASLEVTWKGSPLSFTSMPISRTFILTWDNLASSYVMSFNSNGGSNVGSLRGAYSSNLTLPTPTRAGYVFNGWYTDNGSFLQAFTANKMPAANYTLYAKWTAGRADYTVRHYQQKVDGSDYVLVSTDHYIGTTNSNATPVVKNYTGFTSPATQTVSISGDGSTAVAYYYTRNSYTLTFELGNGSGNNVSLLKYGSEIVVPSLFRTGYSFTGWHLEPLKNMPAQDLTYSAQWSLNTYTITYDLDGGTVGVSNPASYNVGSEAITLSNPTKPSYIFTGWTGTGLSSATTTVNISAGSTGNRYYTATWKPSSDTRYFVYHLREDLFGNYTLLEAETLKGTTGNPTAAQAKAYTNFTPGVITQTTISADETTIVTINYTLDSYTLTFDASGGIGGNSNSVKYDTNITAPSVTKTGYTFNGWDTPVSPKMPAANTTYTAQWIANASYKITFDKNAANATGSMSDQNFSYDAGQDLTANAYTQVGYSFTGWNTAANGSGTSYEDNATVINLSAVNDDTLILYAQWSLDTYTITYDLDGGTVDVANVTSYNFGSEAITLLSPTKLGYIFTGWTGTGLSSATTTVNISVGSTGNRNYTATWNPLSDTSYSVHHLREDEFGDYTLLETETLNGTTGDLTAAQAKSYTNFTPGVITQTAISAGGATIVTINYTLDSYTLTFDASGGSGGSGGSVKYDADITAPSVTRTGYTFNGWDTPVSPKMPANNTTYTAQWTTNTYNITFDKNAVNATGSMSDQNFTYDATQNLTENAYSQADHSFTGWNTAADGSGTNYANSAAVINLTSINEDTLVLYAQWKNALGVGIIGTKYSAKYQVFDIIGSSSIGGRAFDASWGSAGSSSGHQFSDAMLGNRYFRFLKTGDATHPFALYMYESNGTPVVVGTSSDLYASSLIGSENPENLTASCMTSLQNLQGVDWAKGLVAVGKIGTLWNEGFMFSSANGFGYFISGKTAYSGSLTLNNMISNPTMAQIDAVSDFVDGPLTGN